MHMPDRSARSGNCGLVIAMSMVIALVPFDARADRQDRSPVPNVYKNECSACHLAYPSQYLGVAGWRRVVGGLDRHFGTDASLGPKDRELIARYLVEPDVKRKRGVESAVAGGVPLRITETEWFVRKHREVPAGAWKRPAIRSAANCAACHGGAEQGNFNEHAVRIPK